MKTKSKVIALILTWILIAVCALCSSCTNDSKKDIFVINYTVFVKNHDTNKMDSTYSDQILIKAIDKYAMQKIFDTTIPMQYDSDSISMKSTTKVILQ